LFQKSHTHSPIIPRIKITFFPKNIKMFHQAILPFLVLVAIADEYGGLAHVRPPKIPEASVIGS
jgi:hypothetical protein